MWEAIWVLTGLNVGLIVGLHRKRLYDKWGY